jgi:PAS domain S-box-containing protein
MNEQHVLPLARFEVGVRDVELSTLSLVAASTRNTVIIKDAEHRIKWVNDSFRRNYGYSLDECCGQYESVLTGNLRQVSAVTPDAQPLATVLRYGKDGKKRWLKLESRPIVNENGEISGFIEIENDITDCKLIEEQLHQAKQAAEAETLAKSEFLATMCHEIRNPVSVMIGMMDLALQTEMTDEQREYLRLMKSSSSSLLSIVNNTLDLARIEAGCLEAEHIPFLMRETLNDTLSMLALAAGKKGLKLRCVVAPELPDALLGDPMRLRQIIINLLGNAIKFSENGEVLLRVERETIDKTPVDDRNQLVFRFSVSDCGIGIAREKQARIFAPFLQAEASTARQYGGSGLGLAISARLVQLMKGRIWLESELGAGSTFFFTAHFSRQAVVATAATSAAVASASRPPESDAPEPFVRKKILVVDDNPLSRRLTQLVVEKEGHQVLLADGGVAALALLEGEQPDLVLMDLQMPDLNGAQTTHAIRQREQVSGRHLPIVALTADPLPAAYQYSLNAGMDGCLIKPVQPVLLREFMENLHLFVNAPAEAKFETDARANADEVLDRFALLEQVNGDPQLLAEISDLFLDHCDMLMTDVYARMQAQDKSGFAHALHTLLGMFRSLQAVAAQQTTEQLQGRMIDIEADQVAELLLRLEQDIKVLKTALVSLRNEICWRNAA